MAPTSYNNIFSFDRDLSGADEFHWFYECTLNMDIDDTFKAGHKFHSIALDNYKLMLYFFLGENEFEAFEPTIVKHLKL